MYGAKTKRKVARTTTNINVRSLVGNMSLVEMFERFMAQKRTEGLSHKTLEDYEVHFGYLLGFIGGDMPGEWLTFMLQKNGRLGNHTICTS